MAAELNHTIVYATNPRRSADFLALILGLDPLPDWGPFSPVALANGVALDYLATGDAVSPQHYAFLLTEDEFDAAYARILEESLPTWADPGRTRPGEINHNDGGRGVYFPDPDGHLMEIITRPYGG